MTDPTVPTEPTDPIEPTEPIDPAVPAPAGALLADPVRDVLRTALRATVVLVTALAVLGSLVGWFVAGPAGVWGALLGAGIALVFCGTTLVTTMMTSRSELTVMTMVVLGTWLAKMLVLVIVFALLRGLDFYHVGVFVTVLLLGVAGSFALDFRAINAGRVPHVDTSGRPR